MVERPPEHPDRRSELREDLSKTPLAPPQSLLPYEPVLLRNIGIPDSHTLAVALSRGAYQGLEKAKQMPPEAVIEETKKSGLRGRGGAGFPTGQKWSFVPRDKWPHYLIVNADESEPGTFKDRAIIEQDPHLLIEGTLIAAHALQAKVSYIYIRGEMPLGARRLEEAIAEAGAKGLMGEAEIHVHRGAGAYICGEETGLLESLEGKRGYPRLKPPFPAVVGAFGKPTVVNNVETLANLPAIFTRGVVWYRSLGTEKSPGPKIFCVSGHVQRPGNYERPLGYPFEKLLYEDCGGLRPGRALKAVIPGGSSMPVLKAEETKGLNLDYESVQARGSLLGSAGIIVMDDTTCAVRALYNLSRFYAHESCGQCTPCREGAPWLSKILGRIEHGEGKGGDLELLLDICDNIAGKTICPFGEAAAWPVQGFLKRFRDEFAAHITGQGCPMRARPAAHAAV